MKLTFDIVGLPVPKGRPRFRVESDSKGRTKYGKAYTPVATRAWEAEVAWKAKAAIGPARPLEGPVRLSLMFRLPVPSSWPKARRMAAVGQYAVGRGDASNFAKAVEDGLEGVVYENDRQVVSLLAEKRYALVAGVLVEVEEVEP